MDNKNLIKELNGDSTLGNSLLLFVVVSVLATLLYWASVTELDVVVRGPGKTVSKGQNQLIQSPDSGVITASYVQEGQTVVLGTTLFDIDLIDLKNERAEIVERINSLTVQKERLTAESNNEVFDIIRYVNTDLEDLATTQKELFDSRLTQLGLAEEVLNTRLEQRLTELEELPLKKKTLEENLAFLTEEIETVTPLVEASLAPETRLLGLKRERVQISGELTLLPSTEKRLKSSLDEIKKQLSSEKSKFINSALNELSNVSLELKQLNNRLPSIDSRLQRSVIKSPVAGIVNRITYQSKDAFIRSGDVLMEIVPSDDQLIVEAKIDPKDIAKILVNDDVMVSLTAYDASKYGRLAGKVANISADAIQNNESGEQYYALDVELNENSKLDKSETEISLMPGMVATVEILSGKRTILDYFWQPLVKGKDAAFRE